MGDDDKYDELFLSYVAGFFDGEGSIYIQKSKLRKKVYHNLSVRITNSDKDVLDYISTTLGYGRVRERNIVTKRRAYDIEFKSREAEKFLKLMLPYLRIKNKQALLGIEFNKLKKPRFGGRNKDNLLTENDIKLREEIKNKISILNRGEIKNDKN